MPVARFTAILLLAAYPAVAGDTPEPVCRALAGKVADAARLKAEGMSVDDALADLSESVPDGAGATPGLYEERLPGAVRLPFMVDMGLPPEAMGKFYFDQCMIGS